MQNIICQSVPSLADISQTDWLASSANPTISYDFLKALEDTHCVGFDSGWLPCHLIARQGDTVIASVPFYEKHNAFGEYIFDYNLQETYARLGLRYFPKLLSAVPFTPVAGERILTRTDKQKILPAIIDYLKQQAVQQGYSGVHFNFISPHEADLMRDNGMLIRKTHQYHWFNHGYKDFDDFLQSLSSRKRKNIKKERKHIADVGIRHRHITGSDIDSAAMDIFYQFYRLTYDRKWGQPYLTREFFHRIADVMPDRILLIIGEQDGTAISGALNFIGDDCLIGRNWGCNRAVEFLHFETCYYQALDFACERGLKWVEAGTQGEHKLQRGYEPVLTYSAHYLLHGELHRAYGEFLSHEGDSMDDLIKHLHGFTPYRKTQKQSIGA